MTRIRSTREVSITPPTAPHTSGTSGKTGESGAGAQRFETLYETARQQAAEAWRDEKQEQESPGDPALDDDAQGGGDAQDQEPAEGISATDAPLPLLPAVPPLPPSLALNGALLALRENRRASTSAAHAKGPARKAGVRGAPGKSVHEATQDAQHAVAEPSFGMQMIRRCARAAEGDLLAEHLAERVAGFCTNPAVERAGQWDVAVELDPAILPRTELHLSLSGWGLSLRFDSRDARARQLICDNSNELKTRLEVRLGGRVAVEVTVI
ncbi:Type III secretion protein (HpaP) [Burkholderia sp. OK233]|nr:Type III secretion protein (HpaP) [Burkholderia sp. OK233]